ncbi:MAG: helix-turn-helix domain-containing protein [Rhizobiales bacterium]|nr:helix-turn-helix domain-containing protein [Hyphomicrobiales bacterium]
MSELPPPTREVARLCRLIGAEATMALVERWGGTRLYVPATADPEGEICKAIGMDAAAYLSIRYGGEQFMVPVARRWRVIAYRSRGMSYAQIARATGCGERSVYRILEESECVTRQLDMFEGL